MRVRESLDVTGLISDKPLTKVAFFSSLHFILVCVCVCVCVCNQLKREAAEHEGQMKEMRRTIQSLETSIRQHKRTIGQREDGFS